MARMGPFATIPLPDPAAFEERAMSKKQRRLVDTPSTAYVSNPHPKCPSTPWRVSPYRPPEKQCLTELKRPRCSSNNFEITTKLGEGSFGIVSKAKSLKDNKFYAIKKSKQPIWNTNHRSQYITEIITSQSLGHHKHLTHIYDAWEEGGHILIQMELCEKSLKDILHDAEDGIVPEEQIWKYLAQMMDGLHHVHKHMLVHLDIKPENMLLTADGTLKITDLGSANRVAGSSSFSSLPHIIDPVEGDKIYMAPELLDDQYSLASDIFSVGMTVFEMATGLNLPGSGQAWRRLRSGDHAFLDGFFNSVPLSVSLCNLIKAMMHPDPRSRPTTLEVLAEPSVAVHLEAPPADNLTTRKFKITRKLFQT